MKLMLESTTKTVELTTENGESLTARIYEGVTGSGMRVHCYITHLVVPPTLDRTEFEQELLEHRRPSTDVAAFSEFHTL